MFILLYGNAFGSGLLSASDSMIHFPVYNVREFGAVGDSMALDSKAFQRAIDSASLQGGGTVYVPPGDYLLGTIQLRDNITLLLENGSTIWGSNNLKNYQENRHLIYANGAKDVVISGQGRIHGNGPSFWDNGRLQKWLNGEINLQRTSDMIRFDICTNVVLENIDVYYSALWNIGFGDCSQITIHASPYTLFFRHVEELELRNIKVTWNKPEKPDWGSALRCWKVNNLEIDGFHGRQSIGSIEPAIQLKEVKGSVFIHNCNAPEGTDTFLRLENGTEDVTLIGNDLSKARKVFSKAPGMDHIHLFETGNRLPLN